MPQTYSHNIELLLKKAAIDQKFREILLEDFGSAAFCLALELTPVEWSMLKNIPKDQLVAIIDQMEVPEDDPVHATRKIGDIEQDAAFIDSSIGISFGIRPDS